MLRNTQSRIGQELESVSFLLLPSSKRGLALGIGNNGKHAGKGEVKCEKRRRINHHLLIASDFWMAISTLYQTLLLEIFRWSIFTGRHLRRAQTTPHETNGRWGPPESHRRSNAKFSTTDFFFRLLRFSTTHHTPDYSSFLQEWLGHPAWQVPPGAPDTTEH